MGATKQHLELGRHDLIIKHTLNQGGKFIVICTPLHHDRKDVQRSFLQGSDALKNFIFRMTGKPQALADEGVSKLLKGKMFCGEIGEAKNPKYVDLVRVNWTYITVPGKCACCNNSKSPVIELETSGGSSDDRQTHSNNP